MHIIVFILVASTAIMTVKGVIRWFAKRRSEKLMPLAEKLGMQFKPEKDHSLPEEYKFLNALKGADKCYAKNIFSGSCKDNDLTIFDYHYHRKLVSTRHHYAFSIFIVELKRMCPKLELTRKDAYGMTGQSTLSYNDDIDFKSDEFSKQFCVDSKDKSFAYDVCNTAIIDYLLNNKGISIAIENDVLALTFDRCLKAEDIEYSLDHVIKIRSLMPEYLFKD